MEWYKMQMGRFDEENRLKKLTKPGDHLVCLNDVIQWKRFHPILEKFSAKNPTALADVPATTISSCPNRSSSSASTTSATTISNSRSTTASPSCASLASEDRVPDANTYWIFRSDFNAADSIRGLFDAFTKQPEDAHIITHAGTIVDATFVDAPRQRSTRKENACIKDGRISEA